jgi:hypothetical protein
MKAISAALSLRTDAVSSPRYQPAHRIWGVVVVIACFLTQPSSPSRAATAAFSVFPVWSPTRERQSNRTVSHRRPFSIHLSRTGCRPPVTGKGQTGRATRTGPTTALGSGTRHSYQRRKVAEKPGRRERVTGAGPLARASPRTVSKSGGNSSTTGSSRPGTTPLRLGGDRYVGFSVRGRLDLKSH